MYMPTLARFTSRDPMPVDGTALLGRKPQRTYAYAENNPVNVIDPSGLQTDDKRGRQNNDQCKLSICGSPVAGGAGQHLYLVVRDPNGDTGYRGGPSGPGNVKKGCEGEKFGKYGQLISTTGPYDKSLRQNP